MSSTFFSDTVYQLFGPGRENDVEVFAWEGADQLAAVRITARSAGECIFAVKAIEASPASFVVSDGWRFTSRRGAVEPYDPARPANVDELSLAFDGEYLGVDGPGHKPCVYILTYDLQSWEHARRAARHLLQLGKISPQSYIELKIKGNLLGLSVGNLDAKPDRGAVVALYRESVSSAE